MAENKNVTVQVDTTPSKAGSKTSTFLLYLISLAVTSVLPFALIAAENYYKAIPENSWVAILMSGLIPIGYGIQRLMATGKERDTIARVAEAQATIEVSQAGSSSILKNAGLELLLGLIKEKAGEKIGLDEDERKEADPVVNAEDYGMDDAPNVAPEPTNRTNITDENLSAFIGKNMGLLDLAAKKEVAQLITQKLS
jgi:hypothetical protein